MCDSLNICLLLRLALSAAAVARRGPGLPSRLSRFSESHQPVAVTPRSASFSTAEHCDKARSLTTFFTTWRHLLVGPAQGCTGIATQARATGWAATQAGTCGQQRMTRMRSCRRSSVSGKEKEKGEGSTALSRGGIVLGEERRADADVTGHTRARPRPRLQPDTPRAQHVAQPRDCRYDQCEEGQCVGCPAAKDACAIPRELPLRPSSCALSSCPDIRPARPTNAALERRL